MLSDRHIKEFQALYKKHYGEDISRQRALDEGLKVIKYVALINDIKCNMNKHDK